MVFYRVSKHSNYFEKSFLPRSRCDYFTFLFFFFFEKLFKNMTQIISPNISKMQKFRMRKPPIKSGNRILVIFKITFSPRVRKTAAFHKALQCWATKTANWKDFFFRFHKTHNFLILWILNKPHRWSSWQNIFITSPEEIKLTLLSKIQIKFIIIQLHSLQII